MTQAKLPKSLMRRLKQIGTELATQDNLATVWPIWYVTELVTVYDSEGRGHTERQFASYGSVCFLTQKACQEYIDANSYHYNKPRPYAASAHRNHELQPIIQALILLAGQEVPNNHYGRVSHD